jgi:hypothetical protein
MKANKPYTVAKVTGLLTRTMFKELVFQRDQSKCVVCGAEAKDAHHLIPRKSFKDGGYYLDNGVALCYDCHYDAEQGVPTAGQLRVLAGIKTLRLPTPF